MCKFCESVGKSWFETICAFYYFGLSVSTWFTFGLKLLILYAWLWHFCLDCVSMFLSAWKSVKDQAFFILMKIIWGFWYCVCIKWCSQFTVLEFENQCSFYWSRNEYYLYIPNLYLFFLYEPPNRVHHGLYIGAKSNFCQVIASTKSNSDWRLKMEANIEEINMGPRPNPRPSSSTLPLFTCIIIWAICINFRQF